MAYELQWGRGREAAERRTIRSCSSRSTRRFNGAAAVKPRNATEENQALADLLALQWGRGREAAERNLALAAHSRHALGFNGAAAVKPRNAHEPHPPGHDHPAASMGPRP